jgi:alcohol dehydrogenase class IV
MEDKEREQLIEEIRKLERELYLKRSKLRELVGVDVKELERVIDELISQIGMISIGGNSVEDIRVERGR